MHRILLYFALTISFLSHSQSQEYFFNNSLAGTNAGGALNPLLSCGTTSGSFGLNPITTSNGLCGTLNTYCFNQGEGFEYPNTAITDEYTINVFFKFDVLGGYSRIIDFSNGVSDSGFYLLDNCLNFYPNGNVGTCPYFQPNIYYLFTFVRSSATNMISVYVNGTLFSTYNDTFGIYKLANNNTPIIFFRDDNQVPCEVKSGCVKYISVSPTQMTPTEINTTWTNICTVVNPCPVLPTATLTGFGSVCLGSSTALNVVMTGTPPFSITYTDGVTPVTVNGINSNLYQISVSPTVASTYTLTAVNDISCIGTTSGSVTIGVNSTPTAVISGTTSVCEGSNVTVSVAFTGTPPWSIDYGNGFYTVSLSGITANPYLIQTVAGISQTFVLTSMMDSNCIGTVSGSAVITANPIPTADLSGTTTICSGGTANLSVALTGSAPWDLTYTDGITPVTITGITANPYLIPVSPTSVQNYSLTGVNDANCIGTFTGGATVSVNTLPTATLSGTTSICSGGTTNLNVALTGTAPWSLTYTDGITPVTLTGITANPYLITVSPTSVQNYSLTGVNDANCAGTFSGTAIIYVNSLPTAVLSGTTSICSGSSTDLSVALTGTAPWNLTFTDGTTPITIGGIIANPFIIPVNPSATKTYTLTALHDSNCTGIFSGAATISVDPMPTAVISGTAIVCENTNTTITFNGTPNAILTYTLNSGSPQTITLDVLGKASLLTDNLTNLTTYTLLSAKLNNCTQTQTGTAVITVDHPPVINSSTGNNIICVEWDTNAVLNGLTLHNNLSAQDYTFQWFLNGVAITGATAEDYIINTAVPGDYKVIATRIIPGSNCGNESEVFAVIQSGPAFALQPSYSVSNFFSENQNISLHVTGYGDYEFSLDGGPFQNSSIFNTINSGTHNVRVRDLLGQCEELIIDPIVTMNYPHFFTPNGDGINDTWSILGSQSTSTMTIHIFDRFGKLIKQLSPTEQGWDGTMNNQSLPSTDYWFTVDYIENNVSKQFKSHFALKR